MRTIKFMIFCIVINSISAFADTSVSTQQSAQKWEQEINERAEKLKKMQHRKGWGDEHLTKTPFPGTVADLSFLAKLKLDQDGFEPYKNLNPYHQLEFKPEPKNNPEIIPIDEENTTSDNKTTEEKTKSSSSNKKSAQIEQIAKGAADMAAAPVSFIPGIITGAQEAIKKTTRDENANSDNATDALQTPDDDSDKIINSINYCEEDKYRDDIEKCQVMIVVRPNPEYTSPGCYVGLSVGKVVEPNDFLNEKIFYPQVGSYFCVVDYGDQAYGRVAECYPPSDINPLPHFEVQFFTASKAKEIYNAIVESWKKGENKNYNCNKINVAFMYFSMNYMDLYKEGRLQPSLEFLELN